MRLEVVSTGRSFLSISNPVRWSMLALKSAANFRKSLNKREICFVSFHHPGAATSKSRQARDRDKSRCSVVLPRSGWRILIAGILAIGMTGCSGSSDRPGADVPLQEVQGEVGPEAGPDLVAETGFEAGADQAEPDGAEPALEGTVEADTDDPGTQEADSIAETDVNDEAGEAGQEAGPEVPPEAGAEAQSDQAGPEEGEPSPEGTDLADAVEDASLPDAGADAAAEAAVGDGPPPVARVVLNEVVAKAVEAGPDWVELFNAGGAVADLTGWTFRDEDDLHVYEIPGGITLEAGAFLVLEGPGGTGPLVFDFGFGKSDQARLFDASGALVDATAWVSGAAAEGTSWGRYPDGDGEFTTLPTPTKGAPNVPPR